MGILQTMLRVGDLQRLIDFYTRVMDMQPLRTTHRPEQNIRSRSSVMAMSKAAR